MNSQITSVIDSTIQRLFDTLGEKVLLLAAHVRPGLVDLARTGSASDYFKHILGLPAIEIPWWVERSIEVEPDLKLHRDLAYASITGYYFIHMIDNFMDGHANVEAQILPAMAFFHTEFMAGYCKGNLPGGCQC